MAKKYVPLGERCTEQVWDGWRRLPCGNRAKVDGKCGRHTDAYKERLAQKRKEDDEARRARSDAVFKAQRQRADDAERMAWLAEHWLDSMREGGLRVREWIAINYLREGGLRACIDELMNKGDANGE
jgi:hypothetical protein